MFYQGTKSMRAAVIGTIMPWSGALSNIPKGWIICDGSAVEADQFPLLAQAIGDTYNLDQTSSNFGGSFPNYDGDILLPNLNNGKLLMDIEPEYFATRENGGTGSPIDTDPDARNIIEPLIGPNTDLGAPAIFTDVYTDVEFELTDKQGYSGNLSGNVIIDGSGEKVVYIGGRKLGHKHIRQHNHSGVYETVQVNPSAKPGKGVIPWDNIEIEWTYGAWNNTSGGGDGFIDDFYFETEQFYKGEQLRNNAFDYSAWVNLGTGFGSGQNGRVVAGCGTENPPVNLFPRNVASTPLVEKGQWIYQFLNSEDTIEYAQNGNSISVPVGFRNYYPDSTSQGFFQTLVSNSAGGADANGGWLDGAFQAHNHEPFEVVYDQGSLKPQSRLTVDVTVDEATVLDNDSNKAALQIDMNTSQPSLTCVYIIRAY